MPLSTLEPRQVLHDRVPDLALRELGVDTRPVEAREAVHIGRLELEGYFAQGLRLQVGEHECDPERARRGV